MKRFSTLARGVAVVAIALAATGIVAINSANVPAVGSDYLMRSSLEIAQPEPSALATEEISTLSDWEYTLRLREPKCRFF